MRTAGILFLMAPLVTSICYPALAADQTVQKYQSIDILRPVGAVCTFSRGSEPVEIREKTLGQNPAIGFETDLIAVPTSHENLTVTCRTDQWSETETLIYGPSDYAAFNGPCGPSASCPHEPWTSNYIVNEYPAVVRMHVDVAQQRRAGAPALADSHAATSPGAKP